MWTQIVGKVALALAPPLNHSWGDRAAADAARADTRPLPTATGSFTIEFDFIDHQLVIRASDGAERALALAPRSVADFYAD